MARLFEAAKVTVAALLFPSFALGSEITFRAICEPPQGFRIDYGDQTDLGGVPLMRRADGPIHGEDGFSNARPVFYIDSEQPRLMTALWSGTLPDDLVGVVTPRTRSKMAIIIRHDESEIAAVEVAGGETWAYSFFPKIGAAFFARVGSSYAVFAPTDFVGFGAIYFSRCNFG